jgi:hypothetical protein
MIDKAAFFDELHRLVPPGARRHWTTGSFTSPGDNTLCVKITHKQGHVVSIVRVVGQHARGGVKLDIMRDLAKAMATRMHQYELDCRGNAVDYKDVEWTNDDCELDDCELAAFEAEAQMPVPEKPSKPRKECKICGPEDPLYPAWEPCLHMEEKK